MPWRACAVSKEPRKGGNNVANVSTFARTCNISSVEAKFVSGKQNKCFKIFQGHFASVTSFRTKETERNGALNWGKRFVYFSVDLAIKTALIPERFKLYMRRKQTIVRIFT